MRYSQIKDNDIANGKGVMMSLWTQGCPHRCKGCFNPETWNYNGGMEFTQKQEQYILDNINAVIDKVSKTTNTLFIPYTK